MQFLVVSQRANPNPNYSLKDLTGHGRIDVVMRCILAACRSVSKVNHEKNVIYCYLKGSINPQDWGWIKWEQEILDEDEISIASIIKERWNEIFTNRSFSELIETIDFDQIIHLQEEGDNLLTISNTISEKNLIILGAQADLDDSDLSKISQALKIKLSNASMLASHAIILYRQKIISRS